MDLFVDDPAFSSLSFGIFTINYQCPATVFRARVHRMLAASPAHLQLTHFVKILAQVEDEALTRNTLAEPEYRFYDNVPNPTAALAVLATHATILAATAIHILLTEVYNQDAHSVYEITRTIAFVIANHSTPSAILLGGMFSPSNIHLKLINDTFILHHNNIIPGARASTLRALRAFVDIRVYADPYNQPIDYGVLTGLLSCPYFHNDWFFAGVDIPSITHVAHLNNTLQHETHSLLHAYSKSTLEASPHTPHHVCNLSCEIEQGVYNDAFQSQRINISLAMLMRPPIFSATPITTSITHEYMADILSSEIHFLPATLINYDSPFTAPIILPPDAIARAAPALMDESSIRVISERYNLSHTDQHAINAIMSTPDVYITLVMAAALGIYTPPAPRTRPSHVPSPIIARAPILPHLWNHIIYVQSTLAPAYRKKCAQHILQLAKYIIYTTFIWQQESYTDDSIDPFIVLLLQCLLNIRRFALADRALTDDLMATATFHISAFPSAADNIAIYHLLAAPTHASIITLLDPDAFRGDISKITHVPMQLAKETAFFVDMHHTIAHALPHTPTDRHHRFYATHAAQSLIDPLAYFSTLRHGMPAIPNPGPFPNALIRGISAHLSPQITPIIPLETLYHLCRSVDTVTETDPPPQLPPLWHTLYFHHIIPTQPTQPSYLFDVKSAAFICALIFNARTSPAYLTQAQSILALAQPVTIKQLRDVWACVVHARTPHPPPAAQIVARV